MAGIEGIEREGVTYKMHQMTAAAAKPISRLIFHTMGMLILDLFQIHEQSGDLLVNL